MARVLSIRLKEPQGGDHRFAHVDYRSRFALVAEEKKAGGPLLHAVARYEPGRDLEAGVLTIEFERRQVPRNQPA